MEKQPRVDRRRALVLGLACAALALAGRPLDAQRGGGQFVDELVAGPFLAANGLVFDANGVLYVWERRGKILVVEDGAIARDPVIDLGEEVGAWGDHGLLSVALDPDYLVNGHLYLFYAVDHHHLLNFGTPSYDPQANDNGVDTILRVTRYTVLDPNDPTLGVDPGSRLVLLGESASTGIPVTGDSHGAGHMAFGEDGTLLLSAGDGALPNGSGTALADGILRPKEDVEAWRSQLVDAYGGKLLRIDPATGDGLPSNPFYDPLEPRAPRSRVWLLGLRNPFRWSLRPGTGSASPADGDPGTLYVGDVGQGTWEELNVAPAGGMNFGWPYWEGHSVFAFYVNQQLFENLDAPNPLFGVDVPGVGVCGDAYFLFRDLIVDDGLGPPSWPNPCDPGQQIPADLVHRHTRPELAWLHGGPAVVMDYDGTGAPMPLTLGDPGTGVVGDSFVGNCSIGGTWYAGTAFPLPYQGTYFHADYGADWIKNLVFDASDRLVEVRDFAGPTEAIVALAVHPDDGDLYYLSIYDPAFGLAAALHRIRFTGDAPPVVAATPTSAFGPAPLTLAFDATGSSDPDGGELRYRWDFGDGTPISILPATVHTFPSEDASAVATIASRLDELVPPVSQGPSNPDPEVIRDGVYPSQDDTDPQLQFDTAHFDGRGVPDKGGVDWIGYTYAQPREFLGLYFQEGRNVEGQGGWFETLEVQVRDAGTGEWSAVGGLVSAPPYPGFNGRDFERFELRFQPTTGDGIRLFGQPGGSAEFVTVAELRVVASPTTPVTAPTPYTVELTLLDGAELASTAEIPVSLNNSPPEVVIASPANGGSYSNSQQSTVDLIADATDAEHAPGELACEWRVVLHHDNHVHPEDPVAGCTGQALFFPHGTEGDTVFYETRFTASDPLGLATSVSHYLAPDDDCNLNGLPDVDDVALGRSPDGNANGLPDECESDCDGDGVGDVFAIALGEAADLDGNLVADPCDPLRVDLNALSLATGGTQALTLDAGPAHAQALAWLVGSTHGTSPGFQLGGAVLPLAAPHLDAALLQKTAGMAARGLVQPPLDLLAPALASPAPILVRLLRLDASGRSEQALELPAGTDVGLVGTRIHHAYAVLGSSGTAQLVSNAVFLDLVP